MILLVFPTLPPPVLEMLLPSAALGGYGLWAGSAWVQGAKQKRGLALSELGAGGDTCQAPGVPHGPCPAQVPQEPPRSPCTRHRSSSVRAEVLSCVCWAPSGFGAEGAALSGQGCPSRHLTCVVTAE